MRKLIFFGTLAVLFATAAGLALRWSGADGLTDSAAAQAGPADTAPEEVAPAAEMIIALERENNGQTTSGTVRVAVENPPALPATAPAATGVFLGRSGDLLELGGPPIEISVDVEVINDEAPVRVVSASHQGAAFQVRLLPDTRFYRIATPEPEITDEILQRGTLTVTRLAEPGSVDELGENVVVTIWGEMNEGVLEATIVSYEPAR